MIDGSGLLFSEVKPIERIQILSTLPPKPEVDRLVAQFFDRPNFPLSIPRTFSCIMLFGTLLICDSHPASADFHERGM
jgi:hypothetical protein